MKINERTIKVNERTEVEVPKEIIEELARAYPDSDVTVDNLDRQGNLSLLVDGNSISERVTL